jgi:hypothetical protein
VNVVMQFCTHTSVVVPQVAAPFMSFTPMAASEQFIVQACINVSVAPPDPPDPEAPPVDDPLAPPAAEPPEPEAPPAGLAPPVAEAPPPPVAEAPPPVAEVPPPPVAEVPPVAEAPPPPGRPVAAGPPLLLQAQTQAATPNIETRGPTLYFNISFLIFFQSPRSSQQALLGVLASEAYCTMRTSAALAAGTYTATLFPETV